MFERKTMKRYRAIFFICACIVISGIVLVVISRKAWSDAKHNLHDYSLDVQHTTAEVLSVLTIQEALDIVFDYAVSEEEQQMIFDFEQRGQEKDGGRLRYVWHEEINPEHDRVISEQGYVITSDNTVFRSYLYALGLRDTGGHYIRTEWVNYYWVNMQTGDVIEQRWFDEDICQWQSTQEYERYICEEEPWMIKSPDEMEDISLGATFTTQEVLDELYTCLSENKNSVCDLKPFELWDGRIGYEWYETDKPYYVFRLENTGFTGIPEEKCYAIFEFSVQIYCEDYNAQVEADELYKYYEGEQRMQFYAVDMQTGEIIEGREEGTREYTQEYREKVLKIDECGKASSRIDEMSAEEPIYYSSILNGEWQSVEVMSYSSLWHRIHESPETTDSLLGKIYDFTEILNQNPAGGSVPIRNIEEQIFFHGDGYLSDLELGGNYYTMFGTDTGKNTCFIIKDEKECLVWERGYGVYRLQKMGDITGQEQVYDEKLSFEDNIRIRMEEQGIKCDSYYNNVWSGNWTIEEVIFAENESEAKLHLGETIFYHDIDYFDINIIEADEDKVFYHMPTTGDLGLDGEYYLMIWDEDNTYTAAIVKSEHEMFLIKENTVFRAVQEVEYLDETLLYGL